MPPSQGSAASHIALHASYTKQQSKSSSMRHGSHVFAAKRSGLGMCSQVHVNDFVNRVSCLIAICEAKPAPGSPNVGAPFRSHTVPRPASLLPSRRAARHHVPALVLLAFDEWLVGVVQSTTISTRTFAPASAITRCPNPRTHTSRATTPRHKPPHVQPNRNAHPPLIACRRELIVRSLSTGAGGR